MSLARVGFIPVPAGAKPGFDHADVYRSGRRMYAAHTGADRVDVLDCREQTFLHSLPDLPGVAGEEQDLLFTSDRGAARVSVFRCSDEALLGRVAVGPHPNGLAYDRRRRRLYACSSKSTSGASLASRRPSHLPSRPAREGDPLPPAADVRASSLTWPDVSPWLGGEQSGRVLVPPIR